MVARPGADGRGEAQPVRTCVGCRRVAPVDRLVRIARDRAGTLQIGRGFAGRGAWICAGEAPDLPAVPCIEQATRRQAFSRAFRAEVEPAAVRALRDRVVERARIERVAPHSVRSPAEGIDVALAQEDSGL